MATTSSSGRLRICLRACSSPKSSRTEERGLFLSIIEKINGRGGQEEGGGEEVRGQGRRRGEERRRRRGGGRGAAQGRGFSRDRGQQEDHLLPYACV